MLKIKRLYTFIIQTFIPVFAMTFIICLFIVLMQFIWRYVEDFVGKGLDNVVLAELFLYAALNLIPMALPLSLLLASLMAFGNLGERLELLAIKASGVSLLKTMRPLIILVACISIGAFFFQNEAMPRIQVKFRSLMMSIKQKSPELDIPEGSFYNGIDNYSLYVKKKDPLTKVLKDVMIYDTSEGFDNMSVFVCDSAMMRVSESKKFLLLNLYTGQRFANFRKPGVGNASTNSQFVPYSRENFIEKEIIIPFNAGFDRLDESTLEGTQISKNIEQLSYSIDSLNLRLDTLNVRDRKTIGQYTYLTYRNNDLYNKPKEEGKSSVDATQAQSPTKYDFDSLMVAFSVDERSRYLSIAANDAENSRFNMMEAIPKTNLQKTIRMHKIEWHRKFVLSFACLIFFFIGAPLGAIIRKGGLGMPVVVSVILFIIYYIIDNVGYKMARDGIWEVWQGMWLSSIMLFPLGVFLTYKAMNDSTLFNPEAYGKFFRKILMIKSPGKLSKEERDILISRIPTIEQLNMEAEVVNGLRLMDSDKLRDIVKNYTQHGYGKDMQTASLSILKERGAELDDIIGNQSYELAQDDYANFNQSAIFTGAGYLVALIFMIGNFTALSVSIVMSAIYLLLFVRSITYYSMFYAGVEGKSKLYHAMVSLLTFVCFPVMYFYVRRDMERNMKILETEHILA